MVGSFLAIKKSIVSFQIECQLWDPFLRQDDQVCCSERNWFSTKYIIFSMNYVQLLQLQLQQLDVAAGTSFFFQCNA